MNSPVFVIRQDDPDHDAFVEFKANVYDLLEVMQQTALEEGTKEGRSIARKIGDIRKWAGLGAG